MLARYHARRAEAIALLGGRCATCGRVDSLEMDHVDPATKTFDLGKLWSCSRAKFLEELRLCQLLCGPHHRAKSAKEASVPHGGGASGKRNCRCAPCKLRKAEYAREHRRKGR